MGSSTVPALQQFALCLIPSVTFFHILNYVNYLKVKLCDLETFACGPSN